MRNIIWVDTETGGLNPDEHSLLSVGMVVTNAKLEVLSTQSFFLQHPTYRVTSRAMDINKLNLVEVAETGITTATAERIIFNTIHQYTEGDEKPILGGHNVAFDEGFLRTLVPKLPQITHHSRVDTKPIAEFLSASGIYQPTNGLSLGAIAKDLGVEHNNPHEALSDVMTTIDVYRKFIEMVRKNA